MYIQFQNVKKGNSGESKNMTTYSNAYKTNKEAKEKFFASVQDCANESTFLVEGKEYSHILKIMLVDKMINSNDYFKFRAITDDNILVEGIVSFNTN